MPKIKVKAREAEDVNISEEEFAEPKELFFDEDALNDEFDATYEDAKEKLPFYKKWWFWALLILLLLGLLYGLFRFQNNGSLEDVSATTAVAEQTEVGQTEPYLENNVTVKDFVVPAGASVVKGSQGWGLYDANRRLVSSYNGIASNDLGTWYIKDGLCQFDFNGTLTINDTTYTVVGGKVQVDEPVSEATTSATTAAAASTQSGDVTTSAAGVPAGTSSQKAALAKANEYLGQMAFSKKWLAAQLQSDDFSYDDATWAVDHCGADWNEQAYKKAQEYLKLTTFSHTDLVQQLEFEGFTSEQAEYGVTKAGV